MSHPGRVCVLLFALITMRSPVSHAQGRQPLLSITLPAAGAGGAATAANLFAESDMRELVRSGFPALLRYRLELWRQGGLFDALEGQVEWELIIQDDPSAQPYGVIKRQHGKLEDAGSFATLATAQSAMERTQRTTLAPDRGGARYYYAFLLNIEALSVSDMDQLERWLRGVRRGTGAAAVCSGLRTLMLPMLGREERHYQTRSPSFVAER